MTGNADSRAMLTGATGFVGSAIGAVLLAETGSDIYTVSRNDPDGSRTRRAIQSALDGFGYPASLVDRIQPIHVGSQFQPNRLVEIVEHLDPTEIWHAAAHMNYEPSGLEESVRVNAVASNAMLRAMRKDGRFYHISTVGVAGPGGVNNNEEFELREEPILCLEPLHPYIVSKCLAEYMQLEASKQTGIPLTILRLSTVLGHSETGWVADTRYGYYSYLWMLKRLLSKESEFYLDINPDASFPVVHVDDLGKICMLLRNRKRFAGEEQEIFNICSRKPKTVRQHFGIFENLTKGALCVKYGQPTKGFSFAFNKLNRFNNMSMSTRYHFSTEKLEREIGTDNLPRCNDDGLRNVMNFVLST